jgi:hypothetical protein
MVYRIGGPIRQIGGDDVCPGGPQIVLGNCIGNTHGAHAGDARGFNAGRGVFNRQTFAGQQRECARGPATFVQ